MRRAQFAGRAATIQTELIATHNELRAGSKDLVSAGSAAFGAWAAYVERCRRKTRSLEEQLRQAKQALALRKQKMAEAHQKLRVLENLKRDDQAGWVKEVSRETETFAGEAFLAKLSRK